MLVSVRVYYYCFRRDEFLLNGCINITIHELQDLVRYTKFLISTESVKQTVQGEYRCLSPLSLPYENIVII